MNHRVGGRVVTGNAGKAKDLGDTFFRSKWERNFARHLEFLKQRGVRSYKPDFRITRNDGSQYYEEVKGWMDAKSKTKIKRMAKYYPQIDLHVVDSSRMLAIAKNKFLYPYWED